jgi:outer membrane protein OmpA-like peptidoglycan-associated protein
MEKRLFSFIVVLMCFFATAFAEKNYNVAVDNVALQRDGSRLNVDMALDLSALKVPGNSALLITPTLSSGDSAAELPSVGIYGRRRYYYYLRNYGDKMISGSNEISYKMSEKPNSLDYHASIPYESWMDNSDLTLNYKVYGCCNGVTDADTYGMVGKYVASPKESTRALPKLLYVMPKAAAQKEYSVKGSANVSFHVNKTVLHENYRDNYAQLAKIRSGIDSMKNDGDITIETVTLKGFASPEGSYANNIRLARGRTEELKRYIDHLYNFPSGVVKTDYEPEDWEGLRNYLNTSNINHKEEILSIIATVQDPDTRDATIKKRYPTEYSLLLNNVYPALRHTEYTIAYSVRQYVDVEEIKRLMKTNPGKLSLNEIYLVGQTYQPGTPEFDDLYETASKLFPNDPVANLNAANVAILEGNYDKAERYLDKAGDSGETLYTKGVVAYMRGDNDAAKAYLIKAQSAGVADADTLLNTLSQGSNLR